ncbi:hypothetical protein [Pseudonocardia thermophila]|uniref:hypothetical protein n=1 Tax=Pseudonocardia thermophila TaxID=1848 RepID=UPI00248EC5CB|nr:hypothetical protein [Pseudonocardia thermophila]
METMTPPVVRRPRLSLWLLRAVLTVHLVAAAGQPVFAGLFLTGDLDAITAHGVVGSTLAAWDLLLIGTAIGYGLAARRWWVPFAAVGVFLLVGFQIGFGYARELQLHVPLGVAITTLSVLAVIWVWTPAAARRRS